MKATIKLKKMATKVGYLKESFLKTNCINCGTEPFSDCYIGTIETGIKNKYGTKEAFCEHAGHKYKDFASKLRTVENRMLWLNDFLAPLCLEIQITKKGL